MMRIWGASVILTCGVWGWLLHRRKILEPIYRGETLMQDLTLLCQQICTMHRPLPDILERDILRDPLWNELRENMESIGFPAAWEKAGKSLPAEVSPFLEPLEGVLPQGGDVLRQTAEEIRRDLGEYLREAKKNAVLSGRLSAAVCFSISAVLVLLLV